MSDFESLCCLRCDFTGDSMLAFRRHLKVHPLDSQAQTEFDSFLAQRYEKMNAILDAKWPQRNAPFELYCKLVNGDLTDTLIDVAFKQVHETGDTVHQP